LDLENTIYRPIKRLPKLKINRKISIIAVCFLISTVFWFLIAFSGQYDARLRFPLKYVNVPGQRLIVNDLPTGMQVFVKTTGFKILAYQFGKRPDSIELDVTNALQQGKEITKDLILVPSKALINNFTRQLGNEYSINGFYPDSVAFSFSNKVSKHVPIVLDSRIKYASQYSSAGAIQLSPESVTVTGPGSLIAMISSVSTDSLILNDIKSTVKTHVNLKQQKLLSTDVPNITVTIPVEKFTEGSMEIPVHVINLKKGYSVKTFPDKITVRYHVALSNYNKISPDMFKAIADASGLPDKSKQQLRVNLIETPPTVNMISADPDKVDFILKKE
jgi:hypothetical protein